MRAEVVTIGTELLLGEIENTNASYIARCLTTVGLDMYYQITVGDNEERLAGVLTDALKRSQVIITTGGLGPTVDDITREAVARATGRDLELREDLLAQIEALFSRWDVDMGPNNRRQANIPRGALAIENPKGTAPGFIVENEGSAIISLPGVPREMRFLMQEQVIPYLKRRFGLHGVIRSRTLKVVGLGESRVDERITDLEQGSNPTVGLAAHPGQVDVRITAKADDEESAAEMIRPVEQEIRRRLGDSIFGVDEETLEGVVAALLAERKLRLNILETNTMGQLFQSLKGTPDGDATLGQGLLIATREGLSEAFPQVASLLEREGFPSQVLARDLARSLNRPDGRDLSLAIVGDLAVDIDPYSESAGRTYMTLVGPGFQEEASLPYGGISDLVKRRATVTALNLIRRWLLRSG